MKRNVMHREERFLSKLIIFEVITPLLSALTVFIIFTILNPAFIRLSNIAGIFSVASELGVTTLGVALLLISGEFNLAVSSFYILTPLIMTLMANSGIDPFTALMVSLVITAMIGMTIGITVVISKLHSFILSLGFMMFLRGLALYITGGFPQDYMADRYLLYILNGRVAGDLRTSTLWFLALTVIFAIIIHRTKYGNWSYATGGNPLVAHEVGVPVKRVKIINFMTSSLVAGFAGCFSLSRVRVIDPSLGYGLELETLAAAVIGGCSLSGGYGSIFGAFLGAVTLSMFRQGLVLSGAPPYWYQAFIGPLLVGAASLNYFMIRKVLSYR